VNIDGRRQVDIGPREDDDWRFDDRIDEDMQIGDHFYEHNPWKLDRGHLVRRLDPVWGDSVDEGREAALSTFHFTNCAPQHANFNRGKQIWQGLENYILDNAADHRLRATVFSGPIFSDQDPVRNEVTVPLEFWKVVVTLVPAGTLHATAYLLSQADRVRAIEEFVFGEYRTFQTNVATVADRTGIDLSALVPFDPYRARVERGPPIELASLEDIVL